MTKIKLAITSLLYVSSCLGLLIAPFYVSMPLAAYSPDFPAEQGPRVPAFSQLALAVMANADAICFSILVASVVLVAGVLRRSRDQESQMYWVGVLTSLNFYVIAFLYGMVLVGFFLLPKIANAS